MALRRLLFLIRISFLVILMVGVGLRIFAQTGIDQCECSSFEVIGDHQGTSTYHQALKLASLESYRLQFTDRILTFEDGTQFKLFSAKSLADCLCNVDLQSYPLESDVSTSVTLNFKLFPNGKIGVTSSVDPNSKQARIGAGFPSTPRQVISKAEFDTLPKSKQDIILSRPHQYKIE